MRRGDISQECRDSACRLLEIHSIEYRHVSLMAYLMTVMMDSQRIDLSRLSGSDRNLLATWRRKGWLEDGQGEMDLKVSHKFWSAMCEIVYHSYVDRP